METRANYVAVGAFVLVCMLGFVITLLWLAGIQYTQEYETYRTNFHGTVTGLGKGTMVRYNGIDVGRVTEVRFDPHDPQGVIAILQVQPGLGIRTDSVSSIEPQGLTGGSFVEISGGSKEAPVLVARPGERYPIIKTAPSALQQLTRGAPELLAKLNTIADRLGGVLSDDNQEHLSRILENLDKTTTTLAARSGDLDSTIANMAVASKALPGAVEETQASMKKFGQLSEDADGVVRGQGLAELTSLIADTRRLVISLNRFSDQLDRQPTKLLFGDRRKGYTPP